MEMMTDITLVAAEVLALFCMMLVGVAARLAGILTKDSTWLLSSLLVNVTQPLMILTSMQISYTQERLRTGLFIALLSAGFHVLLSVVARLIYGKVKNSRVMEFGTVFANCAYLGFPVLTVIFGEEGLFYGAFFTLFYNIYIRIYGIYLLTRGGKSSLFKAFVNPGTVASVIGILLFVFSVSLPAPIYTAFSAVGDVTFPLSMIVVGNLVCNQSIVSMLRLRSFAFSAVKLLALPLAALGICLLARADETVTYMCVTMAAMPAGANTAVFSELYTNDSASAASVISISTLLSIGTIPLMIFVTSKALEWIG